MVRITFPENSGDDFNVLRLKKGYNGRMRRQIILMLLAGFLLVSCAGNASPITPSATPVQSSTSTGGPIPTVAQGLPVNSATDTPPTAAAVSNCAVAGVDGLGRSIANSYAFTNAEEVLGWYCQGAEFEDILTALETEELNGTAAEDLLKMRAEGLSWDEIWQAVGFTE